MEHPVIAGSADDGVSLDEALDLVIGELPIAGNERAAVVVACQDRPAEQFRCLPETLVRQVRHIEDHADFLHDLQEFSALTRHASGGARAVRVGACSVVGHADHPESVVPPLSRLARRENRISAFHTEDESEGLTVRLRPTAERFPVSEMSFERRPVFQHPQAPFRFHDAVVSKLPLSHGASDLPAPVVEQSFTQTARPSQYGGEAHRDFPLRISGKATVFVPRFLSFMPASEARTSGTVSVRSRFQLKAFQARSRCASMTIMPPPSRPAFSFVPDCNDRDRFSERDYQMPLDTSTDASRIRLRSRLYSSEFFSSGFFSSTEHSGLPNSELQSGSRRQKEMTRALDENLSLFDVDAHAAGWVARRAQSIAAAPAAGPLRLRAASRAGIEHPLRVGAERGGPVCCRNAGSLPFRPRPSSDFHLRGWEVGTSDCLEPDRCRRSAARFWRESRPGLARGLPVGSDGPGRRDSRQVVRRFILRGPDARSTG